MSQVVHNIRLRTTQLDTMLQTNVSDIEKRIDLLLAKRGISGHTAARRFQSDFKAYLIYFATSGPGTAESTLDLLENDANLTDDAVLKNNFKKPLAELISPALQADPIFPRLFDVLLDNKGKGVGAGELALPLILRGYRFSNESDGRLSTGEKVEVKKNGASLKPVKRGIPGQYEGLADDLNKKYFKGTKPGMRQPRLFDAHTEAVSDPAVYRDYLRELYIGCDTSALAEEVIRVYKDANKFNTAVGKFALREYQRVDGWQNIIFIDDEKGLIVNIRDLDDIDFLGLRFSPKMSRGRDTQAIADGYVNVEF